MNFKIKTKEVSEVVKLTKAEVSIQRIDEDWSQVEIRFTEEDEDILQNIRFSFLSNLRDSVRNQDLSFNN